MDTKFCPECGNENIGTAKFCMSCQNKFPDLQVKKVEKASPQTPTRKEVIRYVEETIHNDIEIEDGESLANSMIDFLEATQKLNSKSGVRLGDVIGTDTNKLGRKALPRRKRDSSTPRTCEGILKSTRNTKRAKSNDS